jgi:hypothetical protein
MSIETARIERFRSPSSRKNACKVAALRPGFIHHDRTRAVVADARQVALAAAVGDLVDGDLDEPLEAALVEVVADDALDDRAHRVPADRKQRPALLPEAVSETRKFA